MHTNLAFILAILSLSFSGCDGSTQNGRRDSAKLNAAGEIASEILRAYKIEGDPYYRPDIDVAKIELQIEDQNFDHQSLATEITKLKSVQSFQGDLHLVFAYRGNEPDAAQPTLWIRYNAKTGKQIEP
ncbi:hypothetical protein GYB59_15115 [bacterium]|nr:hypothetical protein [bacterium]